jgi:DNA-binding NarL/FixJ family response regulator
LLRVVVAEPASPYRRRIGDALRTDPDLEVAAVGTSEGLVRACGFHPPDVALIVNSLPADGGIATTAQLHEVAPTVRVVVWDDVPDSDAAIAALRAGARGVLSRAITPAALVRCVRHVAAGETLLPRHVLGHVIDELQTNPQSRRAQHDVFDLTPRERQVLALVADGHPNRDIADCLEISEYTVKRHVHNLLGKLAVPSRAAAASIYGSARIRK